MDVDNGPRMTTAEFDELFDGLRRPLSAGYGATAEVTLERRVAALSQVRTGESISLAVPLDPLPGPDNAKPAQIYMVDRGDLNDLDDPEPTANKDYIGLDYHGKAVTHLDALCHIAYRGRLHGQDDGGAGANGVVGSRGSSHLPVSGLRDGVVTRGVLLDLAACRGVPWLEPGTAVRAEDVLAAEDHLGLRIGPGDAVLLRSGQRARRAAKGAWDPDVASAGLHPTAMSLLAERRISVLGGDGDSDVRPSPVDGVSSPVHVLALTALGIPLLDNLDLERLSTACADADRHTFVLVVAPLVVPGGTGSPVNPLALL